MDDLEQALRELLTDDRLDIPLRSGAAQIVHEGVRRRNRSRAIATASAAVAVIVVIGTATAVAVGGLNVRESVLPGGQDHTPSASTPAPTPSTPPTKPVQQPIGSAEIGWNDIPYDVAATAHYPGTVADPSVPWCTPDQLTVTAGAFQGATGSAVGAIDVRNRGAACGLQGPPGVAGFDAKEMPNALPQPVDAFRVYPWIELPPGGHASATVQIFGDGARCVGPITRFEVDLGHGTAAVPLAARWIGGGGGVQPRCGTIPSPPTDHYTNSVGEWQGADGGARLANADLRPTILDQDRTVMQGSVLHFRVALNTMGAAVNPCLPFREQIVTTSGIVVAGEDHMLDCRAISRSHASQLTLDMQLRIPTTAPSGQTHLVWETPIIGVQAEGNTVHVVAAPPQCQQNQLTVRPGRRGVGAGSYYDDVVFTNTSTQTCSLRGFPGVEFADDQGRAMTTRPSHDQSEPIETIVLRAGGGTASFVISGGDFAPPAGAQPCPLTSGIRVIAPGLTTQVLVKVGMNCNDGLVFVRPVVAGSHPAP